MATRHYYAVVYDIANARTFFREPATGWEPVEEQEELTPLLAHLHANGDARSLYAFAHWCAARAHAALGPGSGAPGAVEFAARLSRGEITRQEHAVFGRNVSGAASSAATIGLRDGSPTAAAHLSACAVANMDPSAAALEAARMAQLRAWLEVRTKGPTAAWEAASDERERQVARLLGQVGADTEAVAEGSERSLSGGRHELQ